MACFNVLNRRFIKKQICMYTVYRSLIGSAIWSGRALSLGTKVTTSSDNIRTGFKTLSFSQPVYSLFAADKKTTLKRLAERQLRIYVFEQQILCHLLKAIMFIKIGLK